GCSGEHTDALSLEAFSEGFGHGGAAAGREAGRKLEVGLREVVTRAAFPGDGDPRDDGLTIALLKRLTQLLEGQGLDLAPLFKLELAADGTGEVDMEADQVPTLVQHVEGKEVRGRKKAK